MNDRSQIEKVEFTNLDNVFTIGPRVLIEVDEIKSKTIALTIGTRSTERDGKTIGVLRKKGKKAFSEMCNDDEIPAIGDTVGFIKYAGFEVKIEDRYYRIVNDEDICVLERGSIKND